MCTSTFTAFASSLLLAACVRGEEGINDNRLQGSVRLLPTELVENEASQGDNDSPLPVEASAGDTATPATGAAAPVDLSFIGARYVIVTAECAEYATEGVGGPASGDFDYFSFTALEDGTLTFWVDWNELAAPQDTGESVVENAVYTVTLLDLKNLDETGAYTVLSDATTEGSYGRYEVSFEAVKGGAYSVLVAGRRNLGEDNAYTFTLSGFDPNNSRYLVGAYRSSEITERGDPLGGAEVGEFVLNAGTKAWSGDYEVIFLKSVTTCEIGTPGCEEGGAGGGDEPEMAHIVEEAVDEVFLFGGNFPSLNAGLTSKTHYSSTPAQVELDTAVVKDIIIDCDRIEPVLYGWTLAEAEPNNVDWGGYDNQTVVGGFEKAQVAPAASAIGTVDTITGNLDFLTDDPQYEGEIDAFLLSVPESMGAFMTSTFADASYNLDVNLYGADGLQLAAGWVQGDGNPELIDTVGFWDFTLEPGQSYYLLVLPWSGLTGSVDYTIEIEWTAP